MQNLKEIMFILTMGFSLMTNAFSAYSGRENLNKYEKKIEELQETTIKLREEILVHKAKTDTKLEIVIEKMSLIKENISTNTDIVTTKILNNKKVLESFSEKTSDFLTKKESSVQMITTSDPDNLMYYTLIGATVFIIAATSYFFIIKPMNNSDTKFYDNCLSIINWLFGNNNNNNNPDANTTQYPEENISNILKENETAEKYFFLNGIKIYNENLDKETLEATKELMAYNMVQEMYFEDLRLNNNYPKDNVGNSKFHVDKDEYKDMASFFDS